jgi:preprotein translocase subunit SecY
MFRSIANTFANGFKIPELKSRILFTVAILTVCRLIAFVQISGLDGAVSTDFFNKNSAGGGALGIMPYISAAIVIQLLIVVIVAVKKRARQPGHNLPS